MVLAGKLMSTWSENETPRESVFPVLILRVVCIRIYFLKGVLMENSDLTEPSISSQSLGVLDSEEIISFQTEIPKPIQQAMRVYIEKHPNWDQYRLLQAALAGFLIQNGISSRLITRLYIGNMFGSHSF